MFNETPLHFASHNGNHTIVEYLVNHKVDMNAKNKENDILFLTRLLFIMLHIIVILVSLSI